METTTRKPTLTPPPSQTFLLGGNMYDRSDSKQIHRASVDDTRFQQGSFHKSVRIDASFNFDLDFSLKQEPSPDLAKQHFRAIAETLLSNHPGIDINAEIKNIPTIKGNRISVGQVLGRIYVLGSVDAVVEFYRSSISKEQVKDALAFAQDFLEAACEPV